MNCDLKSIVVLAAISIMIFGIIGILYERIKNKKGIGVRIIQFLAVILIIPTILILAIENVLNSETIATLLGAMIGYILSSIGIDNDSN